MVQTINNPDGTMSIIQVDPSAVVAIADGSQAVRTISALRVIVTLVLLYKKYFDLLIISVIYINSFKELEMMQTKVYKH